MENPEIKQSFIEQLQLQLDTLQRKVQQAQLDIVEYNLQIEAIKQQLGQ
jgi:hypothetical protein